MSKGYLPKKVVYVCMKEDTVDVFDSDDSETQKIASYTITPTWPVEEGKSLDSAIRWTGMTKPKMITLENDPVKSVRVINLETRGNGGRAYKVLVNEQFYVDMREDVILDTMISFGIDKGAILKGQYVWGKSGNSLKLVRVGSSQHSELMEGTDRSLMPFLDAKTIEIGGIYEMKSGAIEIYLGHWQTYELLYDSDYSRYSSIRKNERLRKTKIHVSLEWHNYVNPKVEKLNSSNLFYHKNNSKLIEPCYYNKRAAKGKYVKKIGQIDLSQVDIPEIIIKSAIPDATQYKQYAYNMPVQSICIGKEAHVHPLLVPFNLPIVKK